MENKEDPAIDAKIDEILMEEAEFKESIKSKMIDLKRDIFGLYENARVLFNDYYNGFDGEYSKKDIKRMFVMFDNIEDYMKDFRENSNYN